jgi:4-hydroxybenzoate polyprenyltransferase
MILIFIALFIIITWLINSFCGMLAPVAVLVSLGYSYTKRFTSLTHFILGIVLGMAPVGGWIAIRGDIGWPPLILGAGVMLWSAGFDILYACQDCDFDTRAGLYSLPSRMGLKGAIMVSRLSHFFAFLLFLMAGVRAGLHWLFYALIILVGIGLVFEQIIFDYRNTQKMNLAFFRANVFCSITLFIAIFFGTLLKG